MTVEPEYTIGVSTIGIQHLSKYTWADQAEPSFLQPHQMSVWISPCGINERRILGVVIVKLGSCIRGSQDWEQVSLAEIESTFNLVTKRIVP
ncbi:hypothetical protein D9M69_707600 [compost metagenome]